MDVMRSPFTLVAPLLFALAVGAWGQSPAQPEPQRNTPPPRSDSQPQINDEGSGAEMEPHQSLSNNETPRNSNDS